jgi:segregation and condensation protein B
VSDETQAGAALEPQETAAGAEAGNPPDSDAEAAAQPDDSPEDHRADAEQQPLPTILPEDQDRRALLEAIIYVAEEPLNVEQIASGLGWPPDTVRADLEKLIEGYASGERGVEIRGVAGGFKMFTKPEHHEVVRGFVKTLKPKLKLSLPALETLAVIAYKQPITIPEIQAIRGVNAAGVIGTLLNRKLIAAAGRKKVIGKPMLYRTTKEFLLQFGLADVSELPNLKELEELSRAAFGEGELPDELEESAGTSAGSPAASESPADPSEAVKPGVEEMVTAVDRAVHGGGASETGAVESAGQPEDSSAGEEQNP